MKFVDILHVSSMIDQESVGFYLCIFFVCGFCTDFHLKGHFAEKNLHIKSNELLIVNGFAS